MRGLGLVCGVLGVVLGLITEWRFAPFVADGSLLYFLTHVGDLMPITLLMIGLSGVFAFWFGKDCLLPRRGGDAKPDAGDHLAR